MSSGACTRIINYSGALTSLVYLDATNLLSGSRDGTTRCAWFDVFVSHSAQACNTHASSALMCVCRLIAHCLIPNTFTFTCTSLAHRVWNVNSGACTRTMQHGGPVQCVMVTFDGAIVSRSDEHTVKVWNWRKGERLVATMEGHSQNVVCMARSPSGKLLASGSESIKLWTIVD